MIGKSARKVLAALLFLVGLALAGGARSAVAAEPRVHALVIGNNQTPPGLSETTASAPTLGPLQFADDDAAAFFELISGASPDAHLLTVMDRDTQTLYPRLTAVTAQGLDAVLYRNSAGELAEHRLDVGGAWSAITY